MKSIIANFRIISMISTIISSEKSLQKKERGGGLYGNSTQLSVINNARSSLVKKAWKRPLHFHWSVNVCADTVNSIRPNPFISTGL